MWSVIARCWKNSASRPKPRHRPTRAAVAERIAFLAMKRSDAAVVAALADLAQREQRRVRRCVTAYAGAPVQRPVVDGVPLINFCSNDYLGLAGDARLVRAMQEAAARWGAGAGAAHLVTGHTAEHHALEEELAAFTGREAALLFSTGYMANLGVISALTARGEVMVQDRLNHASLIDGARLADAKLLRYRHADALDAARVLEAANGKAALIATDGVFSMDGDIAPIAALARLAAQHEAWLLVDDAHGIGVLGASGRGVLEQETLNAQQVPLLVGTLGKALGSFGAFVAGSRDVVDLILQRARSYIYTTALPPAVAAATRAALRIVQEEPWRRERLQTLIARFVHGARDRALPLLPSITPIQPVLVPGAARCLAASRALAERGYWVSAIRHPTVAAGAERLRVTLSAAHDEAQVDGLLDALRDVLGQVRGEPA
jgi:8-amino-7-oxononanoate synthase